MANNFVTNPGNGGGGRGRNFVTDPTMLPPQKKIAGPNPQFAARTPLAVDDVTPGQGQGMGQYRGVGTVGGGGKPFKLGGG